MFVYIFFLAVIIFLTKKYSNFNSSIFFVLIIFIFHAFRYNVGYDYPEYYKIFHDLPAHARQIVRLEPLNIVLIKFIKTYDIWWF